MDENTDRKCNACGVIVELSTIRMPCMRRYFGFYRLWKQPEAQEAEGCTKGQESKSVN